MLKGDRNGGYSFSGFEYVGSGGVDLCHIYCLRVDLANVVRLVFNLHAAHVNSFDFAAARRAYRHQSVAAPDKAERRSQSGILNGRNDCS